MNSSTRYQVHISRDGEVYIDGEPRLVPDGLDPSQAVTQALHIEAAGSGLPVIVQVQDDRTNSRFDMQVMPDGTTQAPRTPVTATLPPGGTARTGRKSDPLDQLAAAQAAGRAHNFDTARATADELLQRLTAEQGDTAVPTLEMGQFRADLAYLSGEYAFATASWTWLALAWFDRLGPGMRRTQVAAQNATQAWMHLPVHEAGPLASELINMLLEVTTPERTATMRAQITERLGQPNNEPERKGSQDLTA